MQERASSLKGMDRLALRGSLVLALVLVVAPILPPMAWVLTAGINPAVYESILGQVLGSPALVREIALFGLALVALHLAAAFLWAWLWSPVPQLVAAAGSGRKALTAAALIVSALGVFLANGDLYPHSSLSAWSARLGQHPGGRAVSLAVQGLAVAIVAAGMVARIVLLLRRPRTAWVAGVAVGLAVLAPLSFGTRNGGASAQRAQPDVIFIGIDGLRVDQLTAFGADLSQAPQVDAFLQAWVHFPDSLTPHARTFPAYLSLLTGNDPVTHGGRFNLGPQDDLASKTTLATVLRGAGYQTIYAIDETRFSNLDESFGFDLMIAPRMGAADFLLVDLGDSPLPNLVSNLRLGRILFPYTYVNRAAYVTYRPATFDRFLAQRLRQKLDVRKPLFLSVHFELPHWPYVWRDQPSGETASGDGPPGPPEYQAALGAVDAQVAALLELLAELGRLDHALVVLLSDHGEAFEPVSLATANGTPVAVAAFHGTHVLSRDQYQVLLAFRAFGRRPFAAGPRGGAVSLVDVAPTVLDWLGWPQRPQGIGVDGRSLLPWIENPSLEPQWRAYFLETGFSVPSIETGNPDMGAAFAEGAMYYRLGRDGRLSFDPRRIPGMIAAKQRAVVQGDCMLAVLPGDELEGAWYLMNRGSGELWQLDEPSLLSHPQIVHLAGELCARYAADEGSHAAWCRNLQRPADVLIEEPAAKCSLAGGLESRPLRPNP
jgi:hypothetical protein